MSETVYPLAPDGVFRTAQGEGTLLGLPMVFVRLAGCDVACPGCDTDYARASRLTLDALVTRVSRSYYGGTQWVWLTGGEPTLHPLLPLLAALRERLPGVRLALATAGERPVPRGRATGGFDFVSVSPHRLDRWVQRSGDQLNVVPGLAGLDLHSWAADLETAAPHFSSCYVTPLHGDMASMESCLRWVNATPGWRLGIQAHKVWGVA